jgi:hypothetical protein
MGQRGAMFGIDARLALVVFGLLAVIAGYVAFGRLEIARQAALVGELKGLELAAQNFSADMGTFYPFALNKELGEDTATDLTALWDKSMVTPGLQARWNGPYWNIESLNHRDYGRWGVVYAQANRAAECTETMHCHLWLSLTEVPALRWAEVNAFYDEGGGKYPESASEAAQSGRVQAEVTGATRTLFLRLEGGK